MMRRLLVIILTFALAGMTAAYAASGNNNNDNKKGKAEAEKKNQKETPMKADTFAGLALRNVGPALTSGRVSDIAVDPRNNAIYYVAAASGGVWKTTNAGTTWTPIFDGQGSYSIGCVSIDPKNPQVIWVGTGENNSQRSVGYGDGVYKSVDAGKTWENVGLKNSEHIGMILVDPRNSSVVYVAAQGPLWAPGGDRGVYKTTDAGKTWNQVLKISENTGANEVYFDPRNPDILYAAAYQRRRHVWTLIDGGPESAIYKSYDAGATWKKLENGIPKVDMGKIGLAVSPADPDVIYAVIEAAGKDGGTYRSMDAGASWEKRGDYVSDGPQYYNEIIPDPKNVDRVYAMDTWMMVTQDGGKTFTKVGEKFKHVDNHALWIDPADTDHLRAGCDGGLYESWDRGATWAFFSNLPITQFYRLAVDNDLPFYNIYGGTQDNNTIGGPSRTSTEHGIRNSDWFITVGGDGFWAQVDPEDPNIIYSESQYGYPVRFDRKTGEKVDIQPKPGSGQPPLRFNWDTPLIISPHSHTRLYYAANILFRSDDRGDSWQAVSPDLTRQIDRNKLKVMGRVWSVDAVAKNMSTSFYGNIVSLTESPAKEGLIYAGTDDGLIQVTEDGGKTWRKIDKFPGVPADTYVSHLRASSQNADIVFAAFDNHKMGDFKPYLLKSTDRGKTWISIAGDLPQRGSVYAVIQDHVNPDLLFAGTEFGLFFTPDAGKRWIQLKGGMPTIAVKDLAIQKRENDLAIATFGRGFYILDDYSALRKVNDQLLETEAVVFPVKKAWMFIPQDPMGGKERASQGDAFYIAPNPPFGATITYYLKEGFKTKKKQREEAEQKLAKENKDVFYPTWEELTAEDREEEPAILITITDEQGNVLRRLTGPADAGFHRVAWDLRLPASEPTSLKPEEYNPWTPPPAGPLAAPGTYKVQVAKRVEGKVTPLSDTETFEAAVLGTATLPPADRKAVLEFEQKTARLQRAALGAVRAASEAATRLDHLKKALDDTPKADPKLADETRALTSRLKDIQKSLTGDSVVAKYNEPVPLSILDRIQGVVYADWYVTSGPTETHKQDYNIAASEFAPVLEQLRTLIDKDLKSLEERAEAAGAPWTPGRVPNWTKE